MPRTKKPRPSRSPGPAPNPECQTVARNGPGDDVLTLAEAAAYLRLPEDAVVSLVHSQDLPGRFAGSHWRFLKSAIQEWLSEPPPRYSREAQRSVAGLLRDDPDLDRIVEDAMRQRGRRPGPDGTYAGYRPAENGKS